MKAEEEPGAGAADQGAQVNRRFSGAPRAPDAPLEPSPETDARYRAGDRRPQRGFATSWRALLTLSCAWRRFASAVATLTVDVRGRERFRLVGIRLQGGARAPSLSFPASARCRSFGGRSSSGALASGARFFLGRGRRFEGDQHGRVFARLAEAPSSPSSAASSVSSASAIVLPLRRATLARSWSRLGPDVAIAHLLTRFDVDLGDFARGAEVQFDLFGRLPGCRCPRRSTARRRG